MIQNHFHFMPRLCPVYDKRYTHQTDYSPISDEDFWKGQEAAKSTPRDRLIQIVLFIVTFGWLRLILMVIATLVLAVFIIIPVIFANVEFIREMCIDYCMFLGRIYIRILAFCLGIYRIKKTGNIDPKTRCFLFNHQSVLDGPLIYIYKPFIVIVMAEILKVPLLGRALRMVNSLFVDRSKSHGTASVITKHLEDSSKKVIALSPEGKTSLGFYMMKFRTGSFIAKVQIQPVILRYKIYGSCGKNGIEWLVGGFGEWLIRIMSCPFIMVEMEFLPPMCSDEFLSHTPAEKAKEVNLIMANKLGVQAIDRDTKVIFMNPKASS